MMMHVRIGALLDVCLRLLWRHGIHVHVAEKMGQGIRGTAHWRDTDLLHRWTQRIPGKHVAWTKDAYTCVDRSIHKPTIHGEDLDTHDGQRSSVVERLIAVEYPWQCIQKRSSQQVPDSISGVVYMFYGMFYGLGLGLGLGLLLYL